MFPLSKNRREIDRRNSHCVSWERQKLMMTEGWLISHLKSLKISPYQKVNGLRVKLGEIVLSFMSFIRFCIHIVCSFWNLRFYWHANERNPLLRLREHSWSFSSERNFSIPHAVQPSMISKIWAYWVIIDIHFFPCPASKIAQLNIQHFCDIIYSIIILSLTMVGSIMKLTLVVDPSTLRIYK